MGFFVFFWKCICSPRRGKGREGEMIHTLEMKPLNLADPLTARAFSKRGRQLGLKRRRDGGPFFFVNFMGPGSRYLL